MKNSTPTATENPIIGSLEALQLENVSETIINKVFQLAEDIAQYEIDNKTVTLDNVGKVLQSKYRNADIEFFIIVHFDENDDIIEIEEHATGTLDGAALYPREAVKSCLRTDCVSVLFMHNHPSLVETPSTADKSITKRLIKSLNEIEVTVKDHLVLGAGIHSLKSSDSDIWEHQK